MPFLIMEEEVEFITGTGKRPLKISCRNAKKVKQGRFRQNLLGKRVGLFR